MYFRWLKDVFNLHFYFIVCFQVTVVPHILQLMEVHLILVPLLDTKPFTIAAQDINSLEAPVELVKIVDNGLALNHIVLVSYVLN